MICCIPCFRKIIRKGQMKKIMHVVCFFKNKAPNYLSEVYHFIWIRLSSGIWNHEWQ